MDNGMITNEKEEYVYVMSNPSYSDDYLKIGWTREHPLIRADDLHTSGIPTPFVVEFVMITPEGSKLEKIIHEHIKKYRIHSKREFFNISKNTLSEILTNELKLELKLITEIKPLQKRYIKYKQINEIKELYETLEKETKEFLSKLKQENSKLVVKEINTKKFVTIIRTEKEDKGNCLSRGSFCFEDDIINACYFIERDIIDYKETMSYLVNNYEEIINKIGIKTFKDDNKYFKKIILDTQQKLHNIKSKFIWE